MQLDLGDRLPEDLEFHKTEVFHGARHGVVIRIGIAERREKLRRIGQKPLAIRSDQHRNALHRNLLLSPCPDRWLGKFTLLVVNRG